MIMQPMKAVRIASMLFEEKRSLRKRIDRSTTNMELLLVRISTLDSAVFFSAIKYTYAPKENIKPIRKRAAKRFGLSVNTFFLFFFALITRNRRKTSAHIMKRRLTNTIAGTVESLKNMELQDVNSTINKTAAFGFILAVFCIFIISLPVSGTVNIIIPALTAVSIELNNHKPARALFHKKDMQLFICDAYFSQYS